MESLIILVRHAQAVDRMEAEDDFERGLTERGRADSEAAAAAIADARLGADLALVSPSRRTRETFERLSAPVGAPAVHDPMALYHATSDMLERAALEALAEHRRIIMVGHNPGMGGLAHMLAIRAGARDALPGGYPTAAATAFHLDGDTLDHPRLALAFNPKDPIHG